MFAKNKFAFALIALISVAGILLISKKSPDSTESVAEDRNEGGPEVLTPHPLSIEALREGDYPGSELLIEQALTPGSNYQRYVASYKSEGLKIYGLLTIPDGKAPESGFPAIIFNHGYIPPAQYRTTERYIAYTDGFSRNGYILFRPDYRGHGNSEGEASGGYGTNNYTIDVLNALSSVKMHSIVDPSRIGMWGHSMGGHITLRSMVTSKDIKAGVIWAGVVASYPDLLNNWRRRNNATPPAISTTGRRSWRNELVKEYGEPESNLAFWSSISANSYLDEISGPIQIHHGTADSSVPFVFSETLKSQMDKVAKPAELFIYEGADHNLSGPFSLAMERSIDFFDKHVKEI